MFENLKIRNTTKCDCGRQFVITDIEKLQKIEDRHFYSGVVRHYSKAHCPNCGKEVILLLKQAGQTYEVLNVAEEEKSSNENVINDNKRPIKNMESVENVQVGVDINTKNVQNTQIGATIDIEQKDITSNEIICPECKKTFKNKSGLTNHMKTHQN